VFLKDKYEKISSADGLIICTDWNEFKKPEIKKILKLKDKIIFDGRNILDKEILENYNIRYFGVGR
jgi:UDPglucose 6-dehydrogenase